IAKAFGSESAEMKRPVRVWIADFGVAIAAKETSIARDGSMRFKSATVAIPAESHVVRGVQIIVVTDRPLSQVSEVNNRKVVRIEIQGKDATITLMPRGDATPFT